MNALMLLIANDNSTLIFIFSGLEGMKFINSKILSNPFPLLTWHILPLAKVNIYMAIYAFVK